MYTVNINKLKGSITEKGYNQTSFADAIGVGRDTLRAYLKDCSKIPYYILVRMVRVLGYSRDEAMSVFFTQELTSDVSNSASKH